MTYATAGDLRTRIAEEALRAGIDRIIAEIPGFIERAEQRIFHGADTSFPVRVRDMEAFQTLTFTSGSATLPTDFLARRKLVWPSFPVSIPNYQPSNEFWAARDYQNGPYVLNYTVEGNAVLIAPASTGDAQFLYYKRYPTLSNAAATTTNWLLVNAPSIYANATMFELYRHCRRPDEAAASLRLYIDDVAGLTRSQTYARMSGGPIRRRKVWNV